MAVEQKETEENFLHSGYSETMLPGQIELSVPGFREKDNLCDGIRMANGGEVIKNLHENGKHVVARKHHGKIILYVAASASLIGAVAGGVYLRKRRKI